MICASCGETTMSDMCVGCGASALLDGRYRLEEVVGQGAFGLTYRATQVTDGRQVAVKELPFRRIDSMKTKSLFQREARVLRQLNHPQIPEFLDDFTFGEGKQLSLYLVQEFIDGTTLEQEMRDRRYTEEEVLEIVLELLGLLAYLQSLRPPVIHRDIKPANVMRRGDDGRLVLLDFGSVRDAVKNKALGGSTVTGTFGYMAPEQFQGKAELATDIYGLGVLAVVLLTRRQPDTMVNFAQRLEWEEFVDVSAETGQLLRDMLEPDMERRASDSTELAARIGARLAPCEALTPTPARLEPDLDEGPVAVFGEEAAEPLESLESMFVAAHSSPSFRRAEAIRFRRAEAILSALPSEDAPAVPARSKGVVVVVLAFVFVFAGVVVGMLGVRSTPTDPDQVASPIAEGECPGGPCEPVPRGLKNLEFGMTRAQAEAVMPELGAAAVSPGALFLPRLLGGFDFNSRMPGFQTSVETSIGAFPATCDLHFAVQDTLSEMACTLKPLTSLETHREAELQLLATLETRYGRRAHRATEVSTYGANRNGSWHWGDDRATLTLSSEFVSYGLVGVGLAPTSKLTLVNTSKAHERLQDEVRRKADREAEAKRERDRRAEEEQLQKERVRLRERGGSLEDDL
jgi:hypothetical protein